MVSSCSKITFEDCEANSRCYNPELSCNLPSEMYKGCLSAASPELARIVLSVTEMPSKQLCGWKWIKKCVRPWYKDDIAVFSF